MRFGFCGMDAIALGLILLLTGAFLIVHTWLLHRRRDLRNQLSEDCLKSAIDQEREGKTHE